MNSARQVAHLIKSNQSNNSQITASLFQFVRLAARKKILNVAKRVLRTDTTRRI